ncbi:hypothetical protein EI94DRAFT_1793925 [Lactarius quietus]|nr:hypothetical protein EI94DRAFT_1793925 [Lactarius quietus]
MATHDSHNNTRRRRSSPPSSNLTTHTDAHIAATRHYFSGAPDPPEPPYAPSYHPPTGYWTSTEKALFFHALSTYSRFRPDIIASSIGTKSLLDVIVYLNLLQDGAQELTAVRGAIARDQLPAAHEVSATLVDLEDTHATRLAATEPVRTDESCAAARKEAERAMRNSLRVRKGEGAKGAERDREGQQARREEFVRWREEQVGTWAREDMLGRLDGVALQALDRMLRVDEERRVVEADGRGPPVAGPSTDAPASDIPLAVPGDESEDPDTTLASLSPASRRRAYKRLYMRRKRAEARGDVAQLDPTRLKPGRKATAPSRYEQRRPPADDSTDEDEDEQKRNLHGATRPYKVQRKLDELGIGAEYMRENGLGIFRLGALWRLMRLYPRLDPSYPQGVTEFISASTVQALHRLVVRFTRDIVRRALALRELDFARRGHVKMWRLGKRVVRPPHVRRALQTRGACLSKHEHFDGLLERFEEDSEESEEDVPLALLVRRRDDDDDDDSEEEEEGEEEGMWTDEEGEQQHVGTRYSRHREPYTPFVHAPDLVAAAHPFGIYAPGTIPDPLGAISEGVHRPYDEDSEDSEEGLMPDETDDEALEVELAGEALLDTVDARADAVYEAGVWREIRGAVMRTRRRTRKRPALEEEEQRQHERLVRPTPHKRRKIVRERTAEALRSPDGVIVKSAAMIENSDSDGE